MEPAVDWVLFDADGVIQSTKDGWLEQLTAAGGARGQEFVLDVFAAEQACVTGNDFEAAMRLVLERHGIDRPMAEVIDADYWIVADAAMLDAVSRLRASGIRCGLATNQTNARGAYMRSRQGFGEAFDEQFYSYELGVAKPDPAYFSAVLGRLGLPGSRVLFLDDRAENVTAARASGLVAELFPRDGSVAALRAILASYGIALTT